MFNQQNMLAPVIGRGQQHNQAMPPQPMPPVMQPGGGNAPPPVMLQPGQMPTQGENFQYQGFPAGGQVMQPGGGNAPPPIQGGPMPGGQMGDPRQQGQMDFMNAIHDWRDLRPARQGFDGTKQDWHSQMNDWRSQRPDPHGYGFGGGQPNMLFPPNPAAMPPMPQIPTAPVPPPPPGMIASQLAGAPMVGSSLGVIGATPAASSYGLPTY